MKKITFILLMMVGLSVSYAKDKGPKVDVKDDTVTIDDKSVFILEKVKGSNPGVRNYFIEELNGKKLAFIKYESYKDPKEVESANPEGNVNYYQITFIESKQTAEIRFYLKVNKLAEFLLEQKLIQNGTISEESENEFILVNGNPYAMKRKELNGGNTIIINQEQAPKKGVTIGW